MNDDVRKLIWGTIVLFLVTVSVWVTTLLVFSCGLNFACRQAAPRVDRTPIPTLIPAHQSESQPGGGALTGFDECQVNAADLVGAWVTAGAPEADPFPFSDVKGNPCEGTFTEDIQPLFRENQLWFKGAIGCVSCHNADLTERSGGLDLTTYDAILLGSHREAGSSSQGNDILGGGNWESSALHTVLVEQGFVPEGHSADVPPVQLLLYAGHATAEATATPTP